MMLQLTECLGCAAAAEKWTSNNHVTLALLYMRKSVLKLKYLVAMAALYSNLVDNVIKVAVLIFGVKWTLALAAFRTTLVKPLFDAVPMENLLAVAALHWAERDAQADWANKRVHKSSVWFLYVFLTQPVGLLQHEFNQVAVNALYEPLCFLSRVVFEHRRTKLLLRRQNLLWCLLLCDVCIYLRRWLLTLDHNSFIEKIMMKLYL